MARPRKGNSTITVLDIAHGAIPRKKRAIAYLRVSKVHGRDATDSYLTLELQRKECDQVAHRHGLTIVAYISDEDISGKNLDRPGIEEAFAMVDRGEAEVIIVAKLSRFARSVIETHEGLKRLRGPDAEKGRGRLIAGDLDVDTTTPYGKAMLTMVAMIAELIRDLAIEQWEEVVESAVKRGIKIGPPPIGYVVSEKLNRR